MKRRDFMNVLGVVGTSIIAQNGVSRQREEIQSNEFRIGVNTPLQGFFASEGKNYILGSALATEIINKGEFSQFTNYFPHLKSPGLLGKRLAIEFLDNKGSSLDSEKNAKEMIRNHNIVMITGGSSSLEAIANRKVALQNNIVCMDGINHSNDCSDNFLSGYSMFFDNEKTARLSSKALRKRFDGDSIKVAHIYSDYSWSNNQMRSMRENLSKQFIAMEDMRIQYSRDESVVEIANKIKSFNADVVVVNLYGQLLVDFISKLDSEKLPADHKFTIIPLLTSTLRARLPLSNMGPVVYTEFGPTSGEERECLRKFVSLFKKTYGRAPSDSAAIGFYQVMQYANAVVAAGSVDKAKVSSALMTASSAPFGFDSSNLRNTGFSQVKVSG